MGRCAREPRSTAYAVKLPRIAKNRPLVLEGHFPTYLSVSAYSLCQVLFQAGGEVECFIRTPRFHSISIHFDVDA